MLRNADDSTQPPIILLEQGNGLNEILHAKGPLEAALGNALVFV